MKLPKQLDKTLEEKIQHLIDENEWEKSLVHEIKILKPILEKEGFIQYEEDMNQWCKETENINDIWIYAPRRSQDSWDIELLSEDGDIEFSKSGSKDEIWNAYKNLEYSQFGPKDVQFIVNITANLTTSKIEEFKGELEGVLAQYLADYDFEYKIKEVKE